LVIAVISQNLIIDAYRRSGTSTIESASTDEKDEEPGWTAFKANRLLSRQHGVHRSVLKYGAAYCVVLPGSMGDGNDEGVVVPAAVIRPVTPKRLTAFYEDTDDEWPQLAVEAYYVSDASAPGKERLIVTLYDDQSRYMLQSTQDGPVTGNSVNLELMSEASLFSGGKPAVADHDLGVCPVVRFTHESDLDGDGDVNGEVDPLIPIQDQINFGTFNLLMAEQYGAFRQRWVTGMVAPVDEEGRASRPFNPGVDRILASEDPATKFGDFSVTDLGPYLNAREASVRHMATISQVPPYHLLGQIANLSAEALAAARDGLDRRVGELQGVLTDSWRNVFRLASKASGDKEGWQDLNGSVYWRDTSAKSFAATVDALGKAAQMLGIPVTELWRGPRRPTADDVNTWIKAATEQGAVAELNKLLEGLSTGGLMQATPSPEAPYQIGQVGEKMPRGFVKPTNQPPSATPPGGAP
jgi:hypothetical protein